MTILDISIYILVGLSIGMVLAHIAIEYKKWIKN